jgi:hypothetical protein
MGTLNPDIRIIRYGKKELTEVTIYPLSVRDQFKLVDLITSVVQDLASVQSGNLNDLTFVSLVMKAVEENVTKILAICADIEESQADEIIGSMTNTQLADLVESIWNTDFEPMLKKGKSLFDRAKSMFSSRRSLPDSSNSTLNIGSNTSTEEVSKTEE